MTEPIQLPIKRVTRALSLISRDEPRVHRVAPAPPVDRTPAGGREVGEAAGGKPVHLHIPRLRPKTPPMAAPAPNVQRRIPGVFFSRRYKPEKVIGQGGRGAVYKAWDNVLGIYVALKFLPEGLALKPAAVAEIRHEAVITMRLAHENIVRLHNIEMTGERIFLVMEYVDGENLRQILDRMGPLAPASVLAIVRACAGALAYAHGVGIIHRDLKPENIMINQESVLKIVDFGTAMMVRAPGDDTYLEGTPGYMSPEQIRGGTPADARTDVFALGAVTAELLTGRRTFVYDGDLQHLAAAKPEGLEGLSPAVREVLLKALAPAHDDRWPSAVEFHKALARAIEGERAAG